MRCFTKMVAVCCWLIVPNLLAQVPSVPPNPLDDLDSNFMKAYEARAAALQSKHPPYIEVLGSNLVLHLRGQEPVKVRILTDPYHHLKDVAHVPFTLYLLLHGRTQLSDDQLATLADLQVKLGTAVGIVSTEGFEVGQLNRQRAILDASVQLVKSVTESKSVDADALRRYTSSMAPLMLQNADDAGCFQVEATHRQVMAWKALMTEEEWQTLRAVNKNSHQARYRNAATQYFAWLLGGSSPSWSYPGETSRVIYAETLFGKQTDEDEMVDVMVDLDASQGFFGDEWRMSEDILSHGAARCVSSLAASDRDWKRPSGVTP